MSRLHAFHIPVMGIGFSLDTPIRLGRFGIGSAISLVDDLVIERVRRHYATRYGVPCEPITAIVPDARAKRITAYLDLVDVIVKRQVLELRALPFEPGNDKSKYFELLEDTSPLKKEYARFLELPEGDEKDRARARLTGAIVAGGTDVNIMTKLDRARFDRDEKPLGPEFSDAKAALRGFALSTLEGNMIMSAGINPTLFGLLETFPAFYPDGRQHPDGGGRARKGIILKVSDFRSALVQGKFLAKKGLRVAEFRIESGLNCGGHAFATDGHLLGPILQDFRESAASLNDTFEPMIAQYYKNKGWAYERRAGNVRVTVQGGIGTFGEVRRLTEYYGAEGTGWGSPFLLVREATAVDAKTRKLLAEAKEEDLYLSAASPLGVPFNNVRNSSSEVQTRARADAGRPGTACPRGFLATNTEFTKQPICTASREYHDLKLAALGYDKAPPADTTDPRVRAFYDKQCLCNHLGNGALIDLGVVKDSMPVSICPGPNLAYFDREYTLREMIDHIYGRRESLVPATRPHLFAKELGLYVDHFEKLVAEVADGDAKGKARIDEFKKNLERGIAHYRELAREPAYPGENLASLPAALDREQARIEAALAPREVHADPSRHVHKAPFSDAPAARVAG